MPALHWKVLRKNLVKNWKIFKGDLVEVISGKDKGKQGKVKAVLKKKNRLVVSGVKLFTRFTKKKQDKPSRRIQLEHSIHYSNVALVDPKTQKPTRIYIKFLPNGKKVRVAKSGEIIPKPKREKTNTESKIERVLFEKDTPQTISKRITLDPQEMVILKNRYLKKLELRYYNTLKQKYEHNLRKQEENNYKKEKFNYDVFTRAKEILSFEKVEKKVKVDTIDPSQFKSKKISDLVKELIEDKSK